MVDSRWRMILEMVDSRLWVLDKDDEIFERNTDAITMKISISRRCTVRKKYTKRERIHIDLTPIAKFYFNMGNKGKSAISVRLMEPPPFDFPEISTCFFVCKDIPKK